MRKNKLNKLIIALNKNEKRYIKLFSNIHTKQDKSTYIDLFELFEKYSNKDDDFIKERFLKSNPNGNFHYTKNYLFNFILKSMRSYKSERNLSNQLLNGLVDTRFLYDKGLYELAFIHIDNIIEKSFNDEIFTISLQALEFKRTMLRHRSDKFILIEKISVLEKKAIQCLAEITELRDFYSKLNYEIFKNNSHKLKKNSDFFISKRNEILELETLTALSFEATILSKLTLQSFFFFEKNYAKSIQYCEEILTLITKDKKTLNKYKRRYIAVLSNYLNSLYRVHDFKKFEKVLEEMKAIEFNTQNEKNQFAQNYYYLELLYLLNTNNFEKGEKIVEGIKALMPFTNFPISSQITLYYNIAVLFFIQEKYTLALEWFERIIHYDKLDVRLDLKGVAYLMQVLIHFTLENHLLLNSLLRANRRFLKNNESLLDFERETLGFINRMYKTVGKDKKRELLENYCTVLKNLLKEKRGPGIQEVYLWVKAKIENKPLPIFVKEAT